MDVAIIADDLTGAADSAVEFMGSGRQVHVGLGESCIDDVDVLALDLDSRELPSKEAARRVIASANALTRQWPALWYKKLDSTLRGNVAAELTAFASAIGCSLLLVAPSYPAQGRAILDGALWYGGQQDEVEHGRRHLPTLLTTADRRPELLHLGLVREGKAAIEAHLRTAPHGAIVIADALTDSDLDSIAAAAAELKRSIAFAGSAGFAAALGRAHDAAIDAAPSLPGPAPVLLIVGSLHPVSRRQLASVTDRLGPPIVCLPGEPASQIRINLHPEIDRAYRQGNVVTLATPPLLVADPHGVVAAITRVAATAIADYGFQRLFCTGGDLARALCNRLGIGRLAVLGRVREGMPALMALDGVPDLVLVTKAGSFGDDDTLLAAYRYLAGGE